MNEYCIDGNSVRSLNDMGWEIVFILRQTLGIQVTRKEIEDEKEAGKKEENLDALRDYITNMFPKGKKIIIRIIHEDALKNTLGFGSTAEKFHSILERYQIQNPEDIYGIVEIQKKEHAARNNEGMTLFEMLMEMFEENSDIELVKE